MRTMARAEVAPHPVPGGAEPGLVVQEHRRRNRGCFLEQALTLDAVELEDVGLPFLKQRTELPRTSAVRERSNRALDRHWTLVEVGEHHVVTRVGQELTGLDHDPVGSTVERSGRVVDEEDAHRGARMG